MQTAAAIFVGLVMVGGIYGLVTDDPTESPWWRLLWLIVGTVGLVALAFVIDAL